MNEEEFKEELLRLLREILEEQKKANDTLNLIFTK
jgi:hypothetical protein